jgi:hypothetical protein
MCNAIIGAVISMFIINVRPVCTKEPWLINNLIWKRMEGAIAQKWTSFNLHMFITAVNISKLIIDPFVCYSAFHAPSDEGAIQ